MTLDPQQTAAVMTDSRSVLTVAGAGSGKTRVLTERIGHLIDNCKVSPFEIVTLTFTRKAAQEMKERLSSRIGPKVHKLTIGTMHSIALQMLRRFGEIVGLRPNQITIYSEWESDFLLREVAAEIGFLKKKSWKIPKRDIDAMFSGYYERGESPTEDHPGKRLFDAFMVRVRENNALTYGGLLIGLRLLIPTIAKHLHIRHILVDEVQDIDPLQWAIINEMQEAFGAALFVVGDIRQSIYSFRGAVPEYLLQHQDDFTIYELQSNYRSVPAVVEAANRLIEHNSTSLGGWMWAVRESDLSVYCKRDSNSEHLASFLQGFVTTGKAENVAVLARNHALLAKLSACLDAEEVPHTYIGRKTKLTNSEEFRRFHAFLKLLTNPYDNFSFMLIRELVGLAPEDYGEIRVSAVVDGKSHFQAWVDRWSGEDNPFVGFFNTYTGPIDSLAGATFGVRAIFQGAYSYNVAHPFETEGIFQFIFSWLSKNPEGAIQQYLDWLAVYDIQDELAEDTEGITLCTIHAAKGLEWPVVILAGCNEGIIPSKQAIGSGEIEEERRLFYVGITRARDQLILAIRPEFTEREDKVYESPVSRFVGEMNGKEVSAKPMQ
jgi:superfamily I DNA/RNA helicase